MKPLPPTSRAAVDNVHRLFNIDLGARTMGALTGTPSASWRERVKAWFANRAKKVVETTGEVKP